jgi:hypothetical protein
MRVFFAEMKKSLQQGDFGATKLPRAKGQPLIDWLGAKAAVYYYCVKC